MNAIVPKGWCPSLFEPMPAADGLLVRIKPPCATLSAAAARSLAGAAARFGNGTIELTGRANLQIRGLAPDGIAPFAAAMVAAGLADPNPERERRRCVIFPPLAGVDPGVSPTAAGIAAAIEALLADDPRLAALPAKFVVAVDGSGILPLQALGADIHVTCGGARCTVEPAGSGCAVHVESAALPSTVLRLALAFLVLAGRTLPAPRRMRSLVSRFGGAPLFAAAGLSATPHPSPSPPPCAVGWLPWSDGSGGAFGCGASFGVMTAGTLAQLATLAERYGDATLRLTPWRAVILTGVAARDAPALAADAALLGMIVDPADTRRGIVTCAGRPGCASASVDVRADAALLATLGLPGPIHLSGCAKGCAHPAPAPVTLVGAAGRYNLIRGGGAGDPPSACGLTMAEVMAVLRSDGP